MKASQFYPAAALLFFADIQTAFAGFFGTFGPNPVPEPSVFALLGIGAGAGIWALSRKRNK